VRTNKKGGTRLKEEEKVSWRDYSDVEVTEKLRERIMKTIRKVEKLKKRR